MANIYQMHFGCILLNDEILSKNSLRFVSGVTECRVATRPLQWRHNECDGVSITSPTIVYSTVYSGTDERKFQSSTLLAFVQGIHR